MTRAVELTLTGEANTNDGTIPGVEVPNPAAEVQNLAVNSSSQIGKYPNNCEHIN